MLTFRPPSSDRRPTSFWSSARLQPPTTSTTWSASYRATIAKSASGSTWPTSSATAANTVPGAAPSATSIATRRRPACSSAIARNSTRACALAIAVPTSSANADIRCSSSGRSRSGRVVAAITTPHSRPPTTTGLPVPARMPTLRRYSATDPGGPASRAARAGRPVRRTAVATPSPATFSRVPLGAGFPVPFQQPSTVAVPSVPSVPSVSYRSRTAIPAPDSWASSPATAAKISSGAAASATSVATRRSAACSLASLAISSRAALRAGHDDPSIRPSRPHRGEPISLHAPPPKVALMTLPACRHGANQVKPH